MNIKNSEWPIDCTLLLKKLKETQCLPFTHGMFVLPDKCDAITEYRQDYDLFIMQIKLIKILLPENLPQVF